MMLRGEKPLAMFSDFAGYWPCAVLRYLRFFDRHVTHGSFVRHDEIGTTNERESRLHRVLYALPGQAWRIQAMLDLKRARTWSADHERREGELLGYADWQNDIWINEYFAPRQRLNPGPE